MNLLTKLWGELIGQDEFGNLYFRNRKNSRPLERENRWVCYKGAPVPSKVPSKWFLWLHHQAILPPNKNDEIRKNYHWEKDHLPNLTGTGLAYSPIKDCVKSALKQKYTAWRP